MTREEAIKRFQQMKKILSIPNSDAVRMIEAIDMAIEALQEVQKHEETFEWCTDCKEYDKDNYCCHRWSKMIRNTVEELKEYSGLVRCKDCRFSEIFQNDSSGVMAMYCRAFTFERMVAEDDYCSYGERREEVNGFKSVGQAWNTSQERRKP